MSKHLILLMEYDVYLDESGDLGWKLHLANREGGSTRYFTIAYLILPKEDTKHINRFIRKFHNDRNGSIREYKATEFTNRRAAAVSRRIVDLILGNPNITVGSITASKGGVPENIKQKGGEVVLYNHMIKTGICPHLAPYSIVNIHPDERSVPRGSQNSCSDLLKEELWLQQNSNVEIEYSPQISTHNECLQFIDWIANFVWRNYENGNEAPYQILSQAVEEHRLFF